MNYRSCSRFLLVALAVLALASSGASRAARRSQAAAGSLNRQGAAGRKRHLSLVPGLGHQADDHLHDPARGAAAQDQPEYADHHDARRGGAGTEQDGAAGRHQAHHRQRPEDAAGQIGERRRGRHRRGSRRLDPEIRRPDERQCGASRHDPEPFRQSERTAGGTSCHLGARSRHSGPRAVPRIPAIRLLLAHPLHPLRQPHHPQLQSACSTAIPAPTA